ncbi:MAG TPA: hypothetical protein V6C90_17270 [Coleofasciculaceae cyanobacterium]
MENPCFDTASQYFQGVENSFNHPWGIVSKVYERSRFLCGTRSLLAEV